MALSLGKFVLARVATVVIVVVGVTALTWLSVNALRPDLRAGDDRFIFVAARRLPAERVPALRLRHARRPAGARSSDLIRQGLPADLSLLGGALVFGLLAAGSRAARTARRARAPPGRALLEAAAALAMCAPVYVVGADGRCCCSAPASGWSVSSSHHPDGLRPVLRRARCAGPARCWCRGSCSACRWPASSLRMMRASMTDVLDEDYLRTAQAKGLRQRTVRAPPRRALGGRAGVHASPTVTMPVVITNLVLIEQVFSIPGVFTGMKRGIAAGDFDLLFALTAVAAGFVAVAGLLDGLRARVARSADAAGPSA